MIRKISDSVFCLSENDLRLSRFENLFPIPGGVSYNSYFISDERTAVLDGVDSAVADSFLDDVASLLLGRGLDYIIINHMEPDHSFSIGRLLSAYPGAKVVCNQKAAGLFSQFFPALDISGRLNIIADGDELSLGAHTLSFIFTPMVHWPESMMCYDSAERILFSSDAFGSFGAVGDGLFDDEVTLHEVRVDDMRRYYSNIVGKYGPQTARVLQKAAGLDIKTICPVHGIVWRRNPAFIIKKYALWAAYQPETPGVLIAYASMYGDTKAAAELAAAKLKDAGCREIKLMDVSEADVSFLVSAAFKYSHILLASVTYNNGLYPKMRQFLDDIAFLGLRGRRFALIENGSWAPQAGKLMREIIDGMKDCEIISDTVTIKSALSPGSAEQIIRLAEEIIKTL